jgi:hypothetical protein
MKRSDRQTRSFHYEFIFWTWDWEHVIRIINERIHNLLIWMEQEVVQIPIISEVRFVVLFNKQYVSNAICIYVRNL